MPRYRAQDITISAGAAVGALTNANLDTSVALVETTGSGDDARSRKAGYKDWTLSGTARYQGAALTAGSEVVVSFVINTSVPAAVQTFTGTGIISRWQGGGDHESAVDMSFEIVCSDGAGIVVT